MNREEFFQVLGGLSEEQVRKALWDLYWRGSAPVRQRIEAELQPAPRAPREPAAEVDPGWLLHEVEEFAELARSGAYMGGDRRVSPKERTRWRFTFHRLATEAMRAVGYPRLDDEDFELAARALEHLVDLACDMVGTYYFRSEDPVAAARFVVSDAVALLWSRYREQFGFAEFAKRAAPQLVRWESLYGWTRYGFGDLGQKEVPLASVLEKMLPAPDTWETFARCYVGALDEVARARERAKADKPKRRAWAPEDHSGEDRARKLALWHMALLDQLGAGEDPALLDRLAQHPALDGPEVLYLRARLADQRGDREGAKRLVGAALEKLPGHTVFLELAAEVGAPLPASVRR